MELRRLQQVGRGQTSRRYGYDDGDLCAQRRALASGCGLCLASVCGARGENRNVAVQAGGENILTKKEKRHLAELEKRKLCLERRIMAETTSETFNQLRELDALTWAIRIVKEKFKAR